MIFREQIVTLCSSKITFTKLLPKSHNFLQFKTVKLISVDSEGPDLASRYLSVLCTKLDITFMVGFGQSECAQYITNFKRFEHKSVDWLRPKTDETNRLARVLGKKIENFLHTYLFS